MPTNVSWNNQTYSVPSTSEEEWSGSTKVDGLLIALATHGFGKQGGLFTLTNDADFGATAGLKSLYYKSRNASPAESGVFRLGNGEEIVWRNNADSADLALKVNASDQLEFNGNTFITTIGALTASRMVVTNGSSALATNSVTATEAGYLSGVTSAIQTQLNGKASTSHAGDHLTGQSDEIDGDKLDVDWNPTNYTPDTTPSEADSIDNLSAHLYGIDVELGLARTAGGYDVEAFTGADTLDSANVVALCDDSGGSFTLGLPAVSGLDGKIFIIKKTNSDLDTAVTIDPNSSETINGASTTTLNTQGETLLIVCDETNSDWKIIKRYIPNQTVSFTPTGSFTTNTTYAGSWRRIGNVARIKVFITFSGTPNTTALTVNLPANMPNIDTTALVSGTSTDGLVGLLASRVDSALVPGAVFYASTSSVAGRFNQSVTSSPSNLNTLQEGAIGSYTTGDSISLEFEVPITGWDG